MDNALLLSGAFATRRRTSCRYGNDIWRLGVQREVSQAHEHDIVKSSPDLWTRHSLFSSRLSTVLVLILLSSCP